MIEWHHQLDGHEFKQAWGVGDGQGSLGYCSPWDTTERLNCTDESPVEFHRVGHDLVTQQQQKHKGREITAMSRFPKFWSYSEPKVR